MRFDAHQGQEASRYPNLIDQGARPWLINNEILDELQTLKQDIAHLLGSGSEEWRDASNQKAKEIAADVKAFLSDLRDSLALEEKDIERAFAGHATAALTTALVLGIVVGWALRNKP